MDAQLGDSLMVDSLSVVDSGTRSQWCTLSVVASWWAWDLNDITTGKDFEMISVVVAVSSSDFNRVSDEVLQAHLVAECTEGPISVLVSLR